MTWFDSLIGFFSPKAAYTRIKYDRLNAAIKSETRKFDAAANSRRTAGWQATGTSANTENKAALHVLRNRSRELVRNNPYAQRGIRIIGSNVVGKGIRANIKDKGLQKVWDDWANSTDCDIEGQHTFAGMQKIVMEAVAESGECFVRKFVQPQSDGTFPLKLQVLESDFLATYQSYKANNGNPIIQGIEIDKDTQRRIAYHMFKMHPGNQDSFNMTGQGLQVIRIPAEEILHVYRADRPGQMRGIPWLTSVMMRLRDLDDFEDAQLMRQKIAACFSVFVYDGQMIDDTQTTQTELGSNLEPGIIEFLPPGKDVKFASPPGVEGYDTYVNAMLQSIATGLGLSFESLSGNLSQVNFSSARMGWLEFGRNIDLWRATILNPQLNDGVFYWFLQLAGVMGVRVVEDTLVTWVPPRREMIDPTRETSAKIAAIRGGLQSLDDTILEMGKDPQEHYEQIAKTNETLDQLGLTLDTDPRKITGSGIEQPNNNTQQPTLGTQSLNENNEDVWQRN
jgi:lambda family phage portal protein